MSAPSFRQRQVALIVLPVDEHDPPAAALGIAASRFDERIVENALRAVVR